MLWLHLEIPYRILVIPSQQKYCSVGKDAEKITDMIKGLEHVPCEEWLKHFVLSRGKKMNKKVFINKVCKKLRTLWRVEEGFSPSLMTLELGVESCPVKLIGS